MVESIFSRVFAYRQRENHSPTENFLNEIFAYCLENDVLFQKSFFNLILNSSLPQDDIEISTQESYIGYGRPDIEISFDNTSILIECKVESSERKNQLNDYCGILINQKKQLNKYLIFIIMNTKNYP